MNRNNIMFTVFARMKHAYEENNNDVVAQCARCWMDLSPENPFMAGTPEYEAFFQMQRSYGIWKRGDIDRKFNYRKMIAAAKDLCKANPKQPYKYDKKADEEEARLAKEAEEERIRKITDLEAQAEIERKRNEERLKIEARRLEESKRLEEEKAQNVQSEPTKVLGVLPEKKKLFDWFERRRKQ